MKEIVGSKRVPEVEWMKVCRACSYADLCWG
jgi:CRISPR/Cas system-associated exonuclease Cas4 (RecB family)